MIIFRYLMREIFVTVLAVTLILLLIFLSNEFIRYLQYAVSGKISADLVMKLLLLKIPVLLCLLLPLSFFISIFLAYGRLYTDSEMIVLHASGLSKARLLMMTLSFSTVIFLIVGYLMLCVVPDIYTELYKILNQKKSNVMVSTVYPGRFQSSNKGKNVYYVESISRDHAKAKNIFVAELTNSSNDNKNTWRVMMAKEGYVEQNLDGQSYVVAENGHRYVGNPGEKNYQIIQYGTYKLYIPKSNVMPTIGVKGQPTGKLLSLTTHSKDQIAELQWRLSMPLSVIMLTLFAVPLSKVRIRKGRFGQLIPAVLFYIVYANMLFVARSWIENGIIWPYLGMWLIHMIAAIFILFILAFYFRWNTFLRTFGLIKT